MSRATSKNTVISYRRPSKLLKKTHMVTACFKQAFMKVAVTRPGKIFHSKWSRSNVAPKYTSARRYFAHRSAELGRSLATEIFFTRLQTAFFNSLLGVSARRYGR